MKLRLRAALALCPLHPSTPPAGALYYYLLFFYGVDQIINVQLCLWLIRQLEEEDSMCFIGLIGREQLPCCISTIFLSSTGPGWLAGEAALPAVKRFPSLRSSFCSRQGEEAVHIVRV